MQKNKEDVKLVLHFEKRKGDTVKTLDKSISGAGNIGWVLEEGGMLDDEIAEFLGTDA